MLEFYIKENGILKKYDVLVAPSLNTTFDETLDNASVTLKASDREEQFKPDTYCQFKYDNQVIANLVIVSDEVKIFNRGKVKYQHTLQLTQNTRLLQKHLVRNSVFSQPRDKYKRQNFVYGIGYTLPIASTDKNVAEIEKMGLNYNEKFVLNEDNTISVKVNLSMEVAYQSTAPQQLTNFLQCQYVSGIDERGITTEFKELLWSDFVATDKIILNANVKYQDGTETNENVKEFFASENILNKDIELKVAINTNKIVKEVIINVVTPSTTIYQGKDYKYNYIRRNQTDGTQNFSSALHINAKTETYIFTMYDVLDTLRHQYYLSNEDYQVSEETISKWLFAIPDETTELGKILRNTIAPNLTFSGATMYECLAEIFRYYDAIFTLDENNVLGIEFLNEYNRKKIIAQFTDRVSTLSEENYTTGYISYFENALVEETITMGARNSQLGVGSDTEWSFILPHNIHSIEKVEILLTDCSFRTWVDFSSQFQDFNVKNSWVDVTNFIVSEEIYSALPQWIDASKTKLTELSQSNALAYSGNRIIIGGSIRWWLFDQKQYQVFLQSALNLLIMGDNNPVLNNFNVNSDYRNAKIRITYKARVNGRVRVENEQTKYNGETIVNQANGYVDLNKMGLNMLGLSYKLGQPTLGLTQELTTWNDENKIVKGQIYEYKGDRWLANSVNYVFYNDCIRVNVNFIKNYNALSQRIQIDRTKRLSQISSELTTKSEDNYCEYIYVTSDDTLSGQYVFLGYEQLFKSILSTFIDIEKPNLEFAMITPYHKDKSIIMRYDRDTQQEVQMKNIYIPMVKYASGNAICFELSMESPISAGLQTTFTGENAGYTQNALYTDNGWADLISFTFADYGSEVFNDKFPYIGEIETYYNVVGSVDYMQYFKKPNEILAMNFELIHLAYNETQEFVGNALITNNGLLGGKIEGLLLYYSNEEVYSPLDLKGIGNNISLSVSNYNLDFALDRLQINFNHANVGHTKSWAICDLKGNILYACNSDINGHTQEELFFVPKHYRL